MVVNMIEIIKKNPSIISKVLKNNNAYSLDKIMFELYSSIL